MFVSVLFTISLFLILCCHFVFNILPIDISLPLDTKLPIDTRWMHTLDMLHAVFSNGHNYLLSDT